MMYRYFLVPILVVFCAGCGPKVTQVSGRVLLDGKGLENMSVLFQPVGKHRESAFGMTDSEGRFVLKRIFSNKNGLEPGEYYVFIAWQDSTPRSEFDANPPAVCPYPIPVGAGNGSIVRLVDAQGTQTLDFELTDLKDSVTETK